MTEKTGAWAVMLPKLMKDRFYRHYFPDETKLWGCANITSACSIAFTEKSGARFIGGIATEKSALPCPACLQSLNQGVQS